jgi:hypothetical protein
MLEHLLDNANLLAKYCDLYFVVLGSTIEELRIVWFQFFFFLFSFNYKNINLISLCFMFSKFCIENSREMIKCTTLFVVTSARPSVFYYFIYLSFLFDLNDSVPVVLLQIILARLLSNVLIRVLFFVG